MAEHTKIEWATHTFNSWIGCAKVHTGCEHCYAEAQAGRHGVKWGPNGTRRKTSESYWTKPLTWNRKAAKSGERPRIFSSLCDPFEDWDGEVYAHDRGAYFYADNGSCSVASSAMAGTTPDGMHYTTLDDLRRDFFCLIDQTPNLDWLLLTKRPENVRRMWPGLWGKPAKERIRYAPDRSNVWLGVSVSDQATADKLIPGLLKLRDLTPCLFVSVEPLLGPVDLKRWIGYYPAHEIKTPRRSSVRGRTNGPVGDTGGRSDGISQSPARSSDRTREPKGNAEQPLVIDSDGRGSNQDGVREQASDPNTIGEGIRCVASGDIEDCPGGSNDERGRADIRLHEEQAARHAATGHTGQISLIIVGGESGPRARPCNVQWIRSIVEQCKAAGIPCFVKQLGAKVIGRVTDDFACMEDLAVDSDECRACLVHHKGGDPSEWPKDLRIRELPEA